MKNLLIVITGFPGTGKTTFGKKISEDFNMPFISKDDFKEIMFDGFGYKDRNLSKKFGIVSYDILYHVAEANLRSNNSVIIETNFDPKFANKRILNLKKKYDFEILQIRFYTEGNVLFERFKKRAFSENRHSGHCDSECLEEWRPILLKGMIEALDINGDIVDVDTTDFDKINYKEVFDVISNKLGNIN